MNYNDYFLIHSRKSNMTLEIRNITLDGLVPREEDMFARYYVRIPNVNQVHPKGHRGAQLIGLDHTASDFVTKLDKTSSNVVTSKTYIIIFLEKWFNARYKGDVFYEQGKEITKSDLINALEAYAKNFVVCPSCGDAEIQVNFGAKLPIRECIACGCQNDFDKNRYVAAVLRKMVGVTHKKSRRTKNVSRRNRS